MKIHQVGQVDSVSGRSEVTMGGIIYAWTISACVQGWYSLPDHTKSSANLAEDYMTYKNFKRPRPPGQLTYSASP